MLVGKPGAGAAQSGLDLVQDQQPVIPVTDPAQGLEVTGIRYDHASFALHGFQHDGNNRAAPGLDLFQGRQVVIGNVLETGQQGSKPGAHLRFSGCAQGCHGAAVKTALHNDDKRIGNLFMARKFPAYLYRSLIGFRPRVAEKDPLHSGNPGQARGQFLLQGNMVEIGSMDQPARLLRNHVGNPRMGMAQAADRNTAERIQVAGPLPVNQPGALACFKSHVQTLVGCHYRFRHCSPVISTMCPSKKGDGMIWLIATSPLPNNRSFRPTDPCIALAFIPWS